MTEDFGDAYLDDFKIHLVVEVDDLKGKIWTNVIPESRLEELQQLKGNSCKISVLRIVLLPREVETLIQENYIPKSNIQDKYNEYKKHFPISYKEHKHKRGCDVPGMCCFCELKSLLGDKNG